MYYILQMPVIQVVRWPMSAFMGVLFCVPFSRSGKSKVNDDKRLGSNWKTMEKKRQTYTLDLHTEKEYEMRTTDVLSDNGNGYFSCFLGFIIFFCLLGYSAVETGYLDKSLRFSQIFTVWTLWAEILLKARCDWTMRKVLSIWIAVSGVSGCLAKTVIQ